MAEEGCGGALEETEEADLDEVAVVGAAEWWECRDDGQGLLDNEISADDGRGGGAVVGPSIGSMDSLGS